MIRTAGPKVLAVMIALVIWMIASEERREDILERNFQVPLALVGVPSNMVISGDVEETIAVRLRGPASQVRGLTSETLEVTVDLADSRPGTLSIPLQPSALTHPPIGGGRLPQAGEVATAARAEEDRSPFGFRRTSSELRRAATRSKTWSRSPATRSLPVPAFSSTRSPRSPPSGSS
jgi:hypothetical protein